ncbi:MAG TPA: hypothetical protein VEO01_16425 [Pseudonocardiaceae bacterium]|nr:hypothetical protein [Pseudonocardiaceae bacterium]
MATPAPQGELLLNGAVTEDDEREIIAVLAPLDVRVRRQPVHRGADELTWLVLASLPLQAFLSGLGGEAVKDAYAGLKKLVVRLSHHRKAISTVPLVLADVRTGLRIALDADLPAEAYRQLHELKLADYRIGPLHYDRAGHRWRSELDEAAS